MFSNGALTNVIIKVVVIFLPIPVSIKSYDWRTCDQNILPSHGEGILSHLNHPFNYSQNIDCRISIIVPRYTSRPSLCFNFKKFRLNWSAKCSDDYLDIPGLGRFCGEGWLEGEETRNNSIFQTLCVKVMYSPTILVFRTNPFAHANAGFYAHFFISDNPDLAIQSACAKKGQTRCRDGSCVSRNVMCDGKPDCADASDESTHHAGCAEKAVFEESCSFEQGLCGFTSPFGSWKRVFAGPSEDHTLESIEGFVATIYGGYHKMDTLISPPIVLKEHTNAGARGQSYCLSFWFKFYPEVTNFRVYLIQRNFQKKLLWLRNSFYTSTWQLAEIQLPSSRLNNSKIQFLVNFRLMFKKMVLIDDVALSPESCHRGDVSCTFEDTTCGWRRMLVPSYKPWQLHKSPSTSYFDLDDESYLRMYSEDLRADERAVMISPFLSLLPSSTACLFFSLSSKGAGSAFIRINMSDGVTQDKTVWSTIIQNTKKWKKNQVQVDFGGRKGVSFKLEAFNRSLAPMEVGFDDVALYSSICPAIIPTRRHTGTTTRFFPLFTTTVFNVWTTKKTLRHPLGCHNTQFPCLSNLQCLPLHQRCDGRPQCNDWSDEKDCFSQTTGLPISPSIRTLLYTVIPFIIVAVIVIISVGLFFKCRKANRSSRSVLRELPDANILLTPPQAPILKPPPYSSDPPPYEPPNNLSIPTPPATAPFSSNPPPYDPTYHI